MAEHECMDSQPPLVTTRFYEEGVTSLKRELDTYSKLVVACDKHAQMMHSLAFNKEQCQYLVDTLKEVIESSNVVLEPSHGTLIGLYGAKESEKHLLSFKILLMLATKIGRFIEGCSQDAWVPAAMALTNVSEFVSSIGFHLELCRIVLSKKCEAPGGLNLDQVANISKDINEIVKTKASMDKEDLLKKISLALPSLHGVEKDLASYLLQRLLSVAPIPSIPLPESKWVFSQYFSLLRSMFEKVNQGVSIGKGASATVFKAMWLEMEVAVKVFYGEDNVEFQKEVDVLARLCHPNITSMFCCTQERRKCSIVMELMDGDLFTLMQQRLEGNHDSPPFNIWEAIDIMHQIAEGGKYLHEQGVVHRDLKSLNILVKSVKTPSVDLEHIEAKVADFNVSKIKKVSTTYSEQTMNVGSNRWMAPELIKLQSMDNQINVEGTNPIVAMHPKKWDIYSFAIVCYEILTGELPFLTYSEKMAKKMKAMILEGDRPKLPAHCPLELRDLIEKCWNPEPKSRPTFDDICQELKFVKYLLMAGTPSTSKIEDTFEKGQKENAPNHALEDKDERLEEIYKTHDGFSNIATYLRKRGEVKEMMGKHANVLEDLKKAHELEPNNILTLAVRGQVKGVMGKYVDALEDLNKAHELEPNIAYALRCRGELKIVMGRYVDALEDLNKADELEPHVALTLAIRGEVKGIVGKFVDALEDLNKANELDPSDAFTLRNRGEVKRMMGKHADALEDLNKAYELEPNDAFTLRCCGLVKGMMGKYVDALKDFNKVDELEPNVAFTLLNRGSIKGKIGKYVDSLEDLNRAAELAPNVASILLVRGEVKGYMGKYEDALEDLNKADELEPHVASTLLVRGGVKKMMGKYTDALEDLNNANVLEPNSAFTLANCGEVKGRVGNYMDALEDLNKALEFQPSNAFFLVIRGGIKKMMGKFRDALEDLNKAHELDPNVAFTLGSCAEVKGMMGKYVDALEDLNKAHELEPKNVSILRARGLMKGNMGKYVNALEDLNKAYELEPNDAVTLAVRGDVKGKMGKYADGLEDLNKAHEFDPKNVSILMTRGLIKGNMGKYENALEDLNKAHELEPNDAMTLAVRGKVKGKIGKYADALEDLNKAHELESNVTMTLANCEVVNRVIETHSNAL